MKTIQLSFITQNGEIDKAYIKALFVKTYIKKVRKKSLSQIYAEEIQRQKRVSGC